MYYSSKRNWASIDLSTMCVHAQSCQMTPMVCSPSVSSVHGIFPTQRSNSRLLRWQESSLLLSHLGSHSTVYKRKICAMIVNIRFSREFSNTGENSGTPTSLQSSCHLCKDLSYLMLNAEDSSSHCCKSYTGLATVTAATQKE